VLVSHWLKVKQIFIGTGSLTVANNVLLHIIVTIHLHFKKNKQSCQKYRAPQTNLQKKTDLLEA